MYRPIHRVVCQLALGLSVFGSIYLLAGCATLSKQECLALGIFHKQFEAMTR